MITEFILVSFATAIGYEVFRYFAFFKIPVRLAPLVVIAIAYGFTYLQTPSLLIAFAATGGVAIFNRVVDAHGLAPLRLPHFSISRPRFRRAVRSWPPGSGGQPKHAPRIPSDIGQRVPPLP